MNHRRKALLAAGALTAAALSAVALTAGGAEDEDRDRDDERVTVMQLDQAPRAVQDAFRAFVPGAAPSRVERVIDENVITFEIEYPKDGATASVTLSEAGDTVEVESPVRAGALPAAVTAAIAETYPGAKVSQAQSVQAFYYEVQLADGGRTHEIKARATGEIRSEHARADREEDEEAEHHGKQGARHEEDEDDD